MINSIDSDLKQKQAKYLFEMMDSDKNGIVMAKSVKDMLTKNDICLYTLEKSNPNHNKIVPEERNIIISTEYDD